MGELHRHGGRGQLLEVVTAAPGGKQHEGRSKALASGSEKVGHRSGDHVGITLYLVPNSRLDRGEIGDNGAEDVYVFCGSQIWTSSASIASPKRLAAISSNCCGTAVTRTS
jgi:hypothetical protein